MKKTLFLVLFALLGLASAWAYDFSAVAPTGQTLYYTITSSSSHTVSVVPPYSTGWLASNTPTGSLTIPSTVTYGGTAYSVTSIGDLAFDYCSGLTGSLTIPNSVTSIGIYAFADCTSLASVTIPNSVTSIGSYAFLDCTSLTSVTIPNSVTSIGNLAFYYCSGLTHVTFNARNCNDFSNNETFTGCTNISTFTLGDSVQRIPAYLCCGLAITSITIPNSVTSIGHEAFYGCSGLTGSLTIPNSVTSIGSSAFAGCSGLTGRLTIPNSVTSIGDRAFYRCSGLTGSLTIPNSVTSIGSSAFAGCSGLTGSLTIPNSVTSIGSSAFAGCSGLSHVTFNAQNCNDFERYSSNDPRLPFTGCTNISTFTLGNSVQRIPAFLCYGLAITSITIPNSVTSIGNCAFEGCSGLTGSLTIPNSVTSIESYAFAGCSGLTGSLTIPNSVTSIGIYAFRNCTSLNHVTFNVQNCEDFGYYSSSDPRLPFTGCTNISTFTLGNSVQRIPAYLCYGLAITSITIPNSVTSIGRYAFADCTSLASVTIPNSVTSIGIYAFRNCTSLSHVTFNAQNCDDFEYYSNDPRLPFTGCTNISTFTLGDSVQRIPAYLCYGLAITSITIPNSVTSIGYEAFYGCSGLTGSLTIPNSVTSIGGAAFEGCSGLTGSLTIPNSVTSIEGYTFYGCSGLTGSLIISDSVASIGDGAFAGCGRLKYLSLGRDVYSIGYHAFYGCSSITEITSKATLAPTLGEDAFEGVWSGIPVNIPCGSLAPYQDRWSYFSNFVECGAEEGIDDVEVPAYEVSSEQGGIVVKAAAGERVRVFDIAGRLLYQGRIEEEPWHYRVEKSGVYLVQIADSPAQKVVVIE